ncbi:MAG: M20/M25/M40 family metallo-hydrolase [Acidobacteriota bacterium]
MDFARQLALTQQIVDLDSTTGREGEAAAAVAGALRDLGYRVVEQPVSNGRFNVYASLDAPVVVLSTHLDCVPPFFPSRLDGDRLYGRGTCDAKGIAVAQMAAAERLRAAGERRVALLFVVGEERGSDGAKLANTIAPGSRFLINGEPTDNRLGSATRGLYRTRLRATGRAAHTSQPELGDSAIEKLLDALIRLRTVQWPVDPDLGTAYYTVGMIKGGVAPNVVPPEAEAEVLFRSVGEHGPLRHLLDGCTGTGITVDELLIVPPVKLITMPDLPTAVFNFTTDIPFLDHWGAPLLVGPGSVTVAHTDHEYVGLNDLQDAVDLYAKLARRLLDA